ncbi:PfkB-like carbohydrate kinase family protein isoform 1 [Theobroma cacao]|uniref:pyridoxal kinase n=1 Tax=Theobroma cacao TaxID=3641 RepID=A0A061ENU8_THECC|nr:PfkB-like carbohydrate kinase family protein isoform 1 [Theobroma cacao]
MACDHSFDYKFLRPKKLKHLLVQPSFMLLCSSVSGRSSQSGIFRDKTISSFSRSRSSRKSVMASPPILSLALPSDTGRVLSIQSHTVQGYVGNKSAVFPLQLLGYDVDPINSVQFSNHTGYPTFKGHVLNGQQLWDLIEGLEANDLLYYTHLLTGYIGSVSFLNKVLEVVHQLRCVNPNLTYVCDPVMGDEGKLYVPEDLVSVYREKVVPVASMLTPNQFEAELLTKLRIGSETDGREACNILHATGPSKVVITSINIEGNLLLIGSHQKDKEHAPEQFKIVIPKIPAYFTLVACLMGGNDVRRGEHDYISSSITTDVSLGFCSWKIILLLELLKNLIIQSLDIDIVDIMMKFRTYCLLKGTGDLMTALLLGWSNKYPNNLDKAAELAVSSLQALLQRTLSDYRRAGFDSQSSSLEIRLIQSQDDIRNPKLTFKADKYT